MKERPILFNAAMSATPVLRSSVICGTGYTAIGTQTLGYGLSSLSESGRSKVTDHDQAKALAPEGATHYFRRYSLDGKDEGFDFYKKRKGDWYIYLSDGEWFFLEFGTWDDDESPIKSL